MKANLYYGQPRPPEHEHGKPAGNIADCEEWLLRDKPKDSPKDSSKELCCICVHDGLDGTPNCSPLPHRHRLKMQGHDEPTVACDNHLHTYLGRGWMHISMTVCTRCTTNAPMPGDSICELCARELGEVGLEPPKNDAVRLKQVGYCINRGTGTIQGCTYYTEPGENLCKFCQNYLRLSQSAASSVIPTSSPRPKDMARIRLIHTSVRHCNITPGCAGNMTATIRRYNSTSPPEMWWNCAVCKANQVAGKTRAIRDPDQSDALAVFTNEGGAEGLGGLTDGVVDQSGMVRNMLDSDD